MRKIILRLIEFGKKNAGALIIGASLIIGLNFERFINYAAEISDTISLAIYNLSGKADADLARYRDQAAQEEAQRAKKEEYERAEQMTWQKFLTSVREKFPQIALVKNSYGGDYMCLRISRTEEVSAYQVRDSISDDFVQWLNANFEKPVADPWAAFLDTPIPPGFVPVQPQSTNQPLKRRDWAYEDLKDFPAQPYVLCASAKDLWRANR
jgi:outer membrane murein-binding lipoprotein Lpp